MNFNRVDTARTRGIVGSGQASSLKRAMRVARVMQGFRPLVIEAPTKVIRGRLHRLHPTKGWRPA